MYNKYSFFPFPWKLYIYIVKSESCPLTLQAVSYNFSTDLMIKLPSVLQVWVCILEGHTAEWQNPSIILIFATWIVTIVCDRSRTQQGVLCSWRLLTFAVKAFTFDWCHLTAVNSSSVPGNCITSEEWESDHLVHFKHFPIFLKHVSCFLQNFALELQQQTKRVTKQADSCIRTSPHFLTKDWLYWF